MVIVRSELGGNVAELRHTLNSNKTATMDGGEALTVVARLDLSAVADVPLIDRLLSREQSVDAATVRFQTETRLEHSVRAETADSLKVTGERLVRLYPRGSHGLSVVALDARTHRIGVGENTVDTQSVVVCVGVGHDLIQLGDADRSREGALRRRTFTRID